MQFFRSLWDYSEGSEGFIIKNKHNKPLTYDSLIVQTDSVSKYLKYRGILFVTHYSKSAGTYIEPVKDSVFFDRLGYYDPYGINWILGGEMTRQRMGDQLPFDYVYNRKNR